VKSLETKVYAYVNFRLYALCELEHLFYPPLHVQAADRPACHYGKNPNFAGISRVRLEQEVSGIFRGNPDSW